MTDRRPLHSDPPPEVWAIGQPIVADLKRVLDRAYDEVAALPGNPAERENDALSMLATIGAFVGLQLSARLMLTKGLPSDIALHTAFAEMALRLNAEIDTILDRYGRPRA